MPPIGDHHPAHTRVRCFGSADRCRFWTYDVRAGGPLRRLAAPKPSAPNCSVRQIALWYRRVAWFEVCDKPVAPAPDSEPQGLFRLRDAGRPAVTLYGPVPKTFATFKQLHVQEVRLNL